MAELLKEAGLPDGVFNVINGGKEIVEGICAHPISKPSVLSARPKSRNWFISKRRTI
jgi:hypothetical protein